MRYFTYFFNDESEILTHNHHPDKKVEPILRNPLQVHRGLVTGRIDLPVFFLKLGCDRFNFTSVNDPKIPAKVLIFTH